MGGHHTYDYMDHCKSAVAMLLLPVLWGTAQLLGFPMAGWREFNPGVRRDTFHGYGFALQQQDRADKQTDCHC